MVVIRCIVMVVIIGVIELILFKILIIIAIMIMIEAPQLQPQHHTVNLYKIKTVTKIAI